MRPGDLEKIERVGLWHVPGIKGGKRHKYGPYWFGWWVVNGKEKRVYIGKELPPQLRWLWEGRVKLPGRKKYSWPIPKGLEARHGSMEI